ncbi:prosaposin-like isoform X1 [Stigmatopora nigra]
MLRFGFLLVVLTAFLRPGYLMFINDPHKPPEGLCLECRKTIQFSTNLIPSKDTKELMYESLHALCQHLADKQQLECDSQLKIFLPQLLLQAFDEKKAEATCSVFGLCASQNRMDALPIPHHNPDKDMPAVTNTHDQFNPTCTLCLYIIKKIENLLPENTTEEALKKIMGDVCNLLPESYKEECDDFIAKYGVEIVEFLLTSAAPHTICTLLHVCWFRDSPAPGELQLDRLNIWAFPISDKFPGVTSVSDCESCRTLAVLSRLQLGANATKSQTSFFLHSLCDLHPNAIPKCEAFTKIYGERLQQVLEQQVDRKDICERADLCTPKPELVGSNPCTWGPSYWCKDINTAQKCGNMAFCMKHIWKE